MILVVENALPVTSILCLISLKKGEWYWVLHNTSLLITEVSPKTKEFSVIIHNLPQPYILLVVHIFYCSCINNTVYGQPNEGVW